MNKGTVLALLVVVLGGGYGLGKLVLKDKGSTATASTSAKIAMPGKNEQGPSDGVDRVRVPPEGATKGGANAKVTIVEFSDFQCPFCLRVMPTLKRVKQTYGDKVRIVWKDFPLTQIHPQAFKAAEAGNCAREQGKFWEYHDRLFSNQQALQPDYLKKYAADAGLDTTKFNACLDTAKYSDRVQEQMGVGTGRPARD